MATVGLVGVGLLGAAGAALPLTDAAERLYAAAAAAGHGDEDLAVVLTALAALRPRRAEA
jgi:3-hydroxyisobutyrate dehydrogenase-like beta-hydroxyacid dehydrogenase